MFAHMLTTANGSTTVFNNSIHRMENSKSTCDLTTYVTAIIDQRK